VSEEDYGKQFESRYLEAAVPAHSTATLDGHERRDKLLRHFTLSPTGTEQVCDVSVDGKSTLESILKTNLIGMHCIQAQ
jgi:hypothetical protein